MKRAKVNSSAIKSIGYDKGKAIVEVEILGSGKVYDYYNVPYREYVKFIEAASIGTYYNTIFKDKFGDNYREVN